MVCAFVLLVGREWDCESVEGTRLFVKAGGGKTCIRVREWCSEGRPHCATGTIEG